jgi:hypothetical protein
MRLHAARPMTTDLDTALASTSPEPTTSVTTATVRKCRRHRWTWVVWSEHPAFVGEGYYCEGCRHPKNEARSRRGKSARRFGQDQERRIERVYGPRKVGEYGDAIDLLGSTFKWQSKATHAAPPLWLVSVEGPSARKPSVTVLGASDAMLPLRPDLAPLVITSYVSPRGTRDWIWVRWYEWMRLHGHHTTGLEWLVMSGAYFLDVHGRDEERAP